MTVIEYPALLNLTSAPVAAPYRFGLFSAVEFAPFNAHDRVGMTWRSDNCAAGDVTIDACKEPGVPDLVAASCGYIGTAEAFTAYILDEDSLAGLSLAEHEAQARARFLIAEQSAVEIHVGGEIAADAALAGSLIDVSSMSSASLSDTYLAMLATVEEQLVLLTGAEGVIYMSRFAAASLSGELVANGGMLRTKLGTPVAAMAGFGAVANTARTGDEMYATGPVKAARSEVDIYNGTAGENLAINDASIIAERTYAFGWDCGAVGASVTF